MVEQDLEVELEEIKRLDKEESSKKFRAIVFFVLPLLIAFLIFVHYFISNIEENNHVTTFGMSKDVINARPQTSEDRK